MHLALGVLWPAFLVAGVAEMLFFSLFDPVEMHLLGEEHELTRTAVYSIGFIFFWAIGVAASLMSQWLQRTQAGKGA